MEEIAKNSIKNAPYLNQARLGPDIGNLFVLAPHPDDESLGCGGLIALLRNAGTEVSVVFVTSGSASHTSKTYPPEVLSEMREIEAQKACEDLGIPTSNVHFLRAQDSGLSQLESAAVSALVDSIGELMLRSNFSTIAFPWRRDPHPDHRAVYGFCEKALKSIGKELTKLEYPIWLWKNGCDDDWPEQGEITPYRLDITQVVPKKRAAINRHRTQLGMIIEDDPNGFVLTENLLEPFMSHIEYFFVTRKKLDTLNRDYFDRLYSEQRDPWNFRSSEYELEKYRSSIASLGETHFEAGLELGCSIGIQTRMLAVRCDHLTAMDISETAIREAKKNCSGVSDLTFIVGNIITDFPNQRFNLVTCCEIGYYLTLKDLDALFNSIANALFADGKLLLVHWTPFVPDYPLSGDTVHDRFANFAKNNGLFDHVVKERAERYRIDVWAKRSGVRDT